MYMVHNYVQFHQLFSFYNFDQFLECCMQKGHVFDSNQDDDAKNICKTAFEVLEHFFNDLQCRSITLKNLDAIAVYDKKTLEELFTAFLKLKSFEKFPKSLRFEILIRELDAYEEFKQKRKEILHMLQKILEFATG